VRPTLWLVTLALALAMIPTLWAGYTGRTQTLHDAEGAAPIPIRNRAS